MNLAVTRNPKFRPLTWVWRGLNKGRGGGPLDRPFF